MNCVAGKIFHFKLNFITQNHVLFDVVRDILRNYEFVNFPASNAPLFWDFDNLKTLSRSAHNFR